MIRSGTVLFDVDTREPSLEGKEIVFRARVDPIRHNLERLFTFRTRGQPLIVATTCLHAGPVRNLLTGSARFVGIDETDVDWSQELSRRSEFFLEKRSLGSPEANRCQCAFDVFRWNPNGAKLVQAAGANVWCVFGVSLEYCVHSTALGLIDLGQKVVVLRDAVVPGPGPGGEPSMQQALTELESSGAQITSTGEFLQAHAG